MIIQICVGSACHLKGSEKLVGLFEDALKKYDLENDVTLAGSFCTGRCNREGVTISVDDDVYTGITPEGIQQLLRGEGTKTDKGREGVTAWTA